MPKVANKRIKTSYLTLKHKKSMKKNQLLKCLQRKMSQKMKDRTSLAPKNSRTQLNIKMPMLLKTLKSKVLILLSKKKEIEI